ncbi:MAG: hypothetical protein Q8P59_02620, partial [Dehalococcoidia bacterium]|nr:hypothetical protein [Dehalococcoidia bacterium]
KEYGVDVTGPLVKIWEIAGCICSKRLGPLTPKLVRALERHGEMELSPEVREKVIGLSASTIDRLLKPVRSRRPRRPYSQSPSPTSLRGRIPVRTFSQWEGVLPGSFQRDLVAHSGESGEGFYLNTLVAVDVCTGWSELQAVLGKGKVRVGSGVHKIRQRLPFALKELHSDNGGEFINYILYPWCQREGVRFTHGRPYRKNDQAYVEQKNGDVIRRTVGYDRYSSSEAYAQFNRLYRPLGLFVNFFAPIRKLVSKERVGAKVIKRYDVAKTPYERALEKGGMDEAKRKDMEELYLSLNPVQLRAEIDTALERLWKMADRPGSLVKPDEPRMEKSCG